MMKSLIQALLDFKQFQLSFDDDLVDRMNRQYTSSMLVLMALLVSARQYFGRAIHCWCPEVCATNHEEYANIYCWVDDTYYVPFSENMPQGEEGRDRKITYYQWVPIILVFEAAMFFAPYALWRLMNSRSGIDLSVIVEAAISSQQSAYVEQREKMLRYAVHLLDRYLLAQRDYRTGCLARVRQWLSKYCIFFGSRLYGNYLAFCYLSVKILYTANAIGQLFLLDVFLGYDFHVLGVHVLRHLLFGVEWTQSERFPRVSMCDYRVRQNTNVHRYTVQCVLPINLFNEKIFILVWFWLCLVSTITACGLVSWLYQLAYWPSQYRHVRRHLSAVGLADHDPIDVKRFADAYLRRDGLFILRLVAKNAGELVSTELLVGLWETYSLKHRSLQLTVVSSQSSSTSAMLRPWRKAPKLPKIVTGGKGASDGKVKSTSVVGLPAEQAQV